jgi:hyperosmotically inducible protein
MRARHPAALGVVVVLALSAGSVLAADPAAQEKAIQDLIVAKLGDDAASIRVTLVGSKAILTGAVKERPVQELAEEVALSVAGVKKVDNQVESSSGGTLGKGLLREEAADGKLEAGVQKALKGEIGSHTKTIEIEACDGWVSLRGTSPDKARKEIALTTAAKVDGVKKVIDLLTVAGT